MMYENTESDITPDDLDADAWTIMRVIAEQQETTTSEIKRKTDIDKNHRILYRAKKLKKLGWISIHQPTNGGGGVCPAKQYRIVRRGLSDYLEARPDPDEKTLDERLSEVERQIEQLDGGMNDDILQLKDRLQSIDQEIELIRDYLISEANVPRDQLEPAEV